MKRLAKLIVLALTLALIFGASVTVFAAELEQTAPEGNTDTIPEDSATDDSGTETPEEPVPGLLDRFKEYVDEGKLTELLSLAVSIVVLVLINLFKKKFGDVGAAVISSNKSVKDKITDDEQNRSEASKHFLDLIDALKGMIFERMDNIEEALTDVRNAISNGVTAEQAHRLETITFDAIKMLDTVYMGSSTIPSTVKERVAESYNHAERTMRNDEIIGEEP